MDEGDQFHRNEAISAVADEGFMAEEEDDDFDDLYNDVNVGGGFLQSVRKKDEAGARNEEEKEKVKIEEEEEAEEVSIPGLVGESVAAIKAEDESDAAGEGGGTSGNRNVNGGEELKVKEVSQQSSSGGGVKVELVQAPNHRGNNFSQGILPPPPPPPSLGNNENLMRNVNGVTPHGPVGNGAAIHMPGVLTGGGIGGGGGGTFLFVGDLHWWTTDAEVEAELCKYGAVKEVRFFDEKANGKSKGYCQVEFYDPMAATACKEGMDGFEFNGRPCVVAFGNPHSIKRMGEAQVNRNQQALLAKRAGGGGAADAPPSKPAATAPANNNNFNSHAVGGSFQGEENRGFGRGSWGRGNAQGMGGRGGQMRNRPSGRGFMGNGGGGFGPMNMMHPQSMMGQGGFEQAFGGPMGRMGGYGGFPGAPGPPFPGLFPPVGLPGVAPHVNPAFFGRGMPMNGMGMMPNAGGDGGHNMGMWDPNNGVWGGGGEDLGGGRAAESSYGEEVASDHQYGGEVNHDRGGGRQNHVKEKERGSEREWSGSSDRRNRGDKDAGYERDMPREKDGGDMPERRYRDERETGREREREHHHKDRERSRDRDRERDRHREERDRYGGDHRSKHRGEPEQEEHEDEWNRGRSSRGHSKSRLSREDNHRSRSRDADYGKRRRLTAE